MHPIASLCPTVVPFLSYLTRSCLSRSSFWKGWFSAVAHPLQEFSCSLTCAFPPMGLPSWSLHTLHNSVKHGWNYLFENTWGGFLNPYNLKADFRSWPHKQLHTLKEWYPNHGWGQEGGRTQEPHKPGQARPIPWSNCSFAVCLCCSYCCLVRATDCSVPAVMLVSPFYMLGSRDLEGDSKKQMPGACCWHCCRCCIAMAKLFLTGYVSRDLEK